MSEIQGWVHVHGRRHESVRDDELQRRPLVVRQAQELIYSSNALPHRARHATLVVTGGDYSIPCTSDPVHE